MRIVSLSWLLGGLFLGGCEVPTLGSHIRGKPELALCPFPDLNTVPFGDQAFDSRDWHEGEEGALRQQNKAALETERRRLQKEGETLRSQVFHSDEGLKSLKTTGDSKGFLKR